MANAKFGLGPFLIILASLLAAACNTPAVQQSKQEGPPVPPTSLAQEFKDCTWAETRGAGVSLWGFACPSVRMVADEKLPGIVQSHPDDATAPVTPVVHVFPIEKGAAIESALSAVQAASPAPDVKLCAFEPSKTMAGWYEFVPTGALKASYAKFTSGTADGPAMPCGEMGPSEAGGRYFKILDGTAPKVAVAFMPSDIPSFDIQTLAAVP